MNRTTALTSLLSAVLAPVGVKAQTMPAPTASIQELPRWSRRHVTDIIRNNHKIVSPDGIEDLIGIPLNGITQWLSIRGRKKANPVLLFLHGGPGSPTMPAAWTFQTPWEDFFTVVQWDQRGAGKTYAANDYASLDHTMNLQQSVDDALEVAKYLSGRFGKEKIFMLGHSWGSMVGLSFAKQHGQLLHAYVGCGQIINSARSEAEGYEFALREARANGNTEAVKELEPLAPYPGPIGTLTVDRISAQRKWLMYYGGLTYQRNDFQYDADTWALSPEYTDHDLELVDKGSLYSLTRLLAEVERADFDGVTELQCPTVMFCGRHDYATSHTVVPPWLARLKAPKKKLVFFEDSAHMMMIEQPGLFLHHLVADVLPLA